MAHGCTYCTDDFHCEKFTNEKYTSWCYGKDYPCKDRRISNADRIRSMTDEELGRFINSIITVNFDPFTRIEGKLILDVEEWLRKEVEE